MYQFHFIDSRGQTPTLDFFECPDDSAAQQIGCQQLSLHPSCTAVDVFENERLVGRLTRARRLQNETAADNRGQAAR